MVTTSIKQKVLGTILSVDELHQYDIPEQIIEQMKTWEIIYKSPYCNKIVEYTHSFKSYENKSRIYKLEKL